jgi:hypothetical protein
MPRGYGDRLAQHPCQATRPLSLQLGCVQLVDILVVTPRSDLEKPIEFSLGRAIKAAGTLFQSRAIVDPDGPPCGRDQPFGFQLVEGNSDPGPAHAQHQGQEVVGQSQAISRRTVVGHQQPARQSLVDPPLRVGQCGIDRPWRSSSAAVSRATWLAASSTTGKPVGARCHNGLARGDLDGCHAVGILPDHQVKTDISEHDQDIPEQDERRWYPRSPETMVKRRHDGQRRDRDQGDGHDELLWPVLLGPRPNPQATCEKLGVRLGKVDGERERTDEKDRQEQPGLPVVQRSGGQKDQSPHHERELQEVECGLALDAVHDVPSQAGVP